MNEEQLKAAIVQRLSEFMRYPRVDLFVETYQAREVAVTGAVQKPGRYDLPNRNESIIDMIGRAGGMTSDSAQKVILVPAKFGRTVRRKKVRSVSMDRHTMPRGRALFVRLHSKMGPHFPASREPVRTPA